MLREYEGCPTYPEEHIRELASSDVFGDVELISEANQIVHDLRNPLTADCDLDRPAYRVHIELDVEDPVSMFTSDEFSSLPDVYLDDQYVFGELAQADLAVIGEDPENDAVVIGHRSDTQYGPLTTEKTVVDQHNDRSGCPCPFDDGDVVFGRGMPISCSCGRHYLADPNKGGVTTMGQNHMKTSEKGLVKVTDSSAGEEDPVFQKGKAFWTLVQHAPAISEYMEDCAYSDDNAYLWAHDGQYIGLLYHRENNVVALIMSYAHRGQGHGTEFVETWARESQYDEFFFYTFDQTDSFFDQLDVDRAEAAR